MNKKIPGYNGRILRVNLSENKVSVDSTDEVFRRQYLGGAGFVVYYLWKELAPGVDPFAPDNRLIFATGGFVLFWLGIIAKRTKKEGLFFLSWLLAIVAYMTYFARGNVTHDYYQLPLVPIGCMGSFAH